MTSVPSETKFTDLHLPEWPSRGCHAELQRIFNEQEYEWGVSCLKDGELRNFVDYLDQVRE